MAYPTTVFAGITVPFTPLIQKAIEHVKAESPPWLFHHVMRSWMFAAKLAEAANNVEIDEETLALAAILHDVGLVSKYSTSARRFEVDGAAAAVSFIRSAASQGPVPTKGSTEQYKGRLRELLVWNAIALHTTPSIAQHASAEVNFCHRGTGIDVGAFGLESIPDHKATSKAVLEAFPRLNMGAELRECLCDLARTKPDTTYDNFVAGFGETYVEGYKIPTGVVTQVVSALENDPFDQ